jgi:DNA recombination-dependent growth factor C
MEIKDHKSSILLAIEMEKVITVILRQVGTIKKLKFDIDFAVYQ